MVSMRKRLFATFLAFSTAMATPAFAETITGALSKAYQFNSSLNSARASVRATDESVPLAKSGYRPQIAGSADISYTNTRRDRMFSNGVGGVTPRTTNSTSGGVGVQLRQMLFDGFQTRNNVAAAVAQVYASNQSLRNTEQTTLFNAAQAYMDVIRDRQIAALTEQNLAFLNEQVRAANSRFEVGEGTRTDVAQAEASRANAVALVSDARARVAQSSANYREFIGEKPGKLAAASPLSKLLPKSEDGAIAIALEEHPAILASKHLVDAADYGVKSAEGAILPQLDAFAGISRDYSGSQTGGIDSESNTWSRNAQIGAQLTIPIYQGGRTSAEVRQAKENLGKARIDVDVNRDTVRNAVSSSWASYVSATEGVRAQRSVVEAARLALNGVIEERNVGQRTTLDVLDAQADVIEAQINLVSDEHDVVVASYAILSALGRLTVKRLGLSVAEYDPQEHYRAVKDKWIGLRTPDGR
ncbi:MAG: TolC family outer membrane protein [Rhizobiaceae bacterium]|nr:TolC family outer membrane protein [Rhizobiaceae bacterium]